MKPLRLEEIWHLLPPLDELRPLLDLLAARSAPDPRHRWTGGGEVETLGARLVPAEGIAAVGESAAARMQEHMIRVYRGVADALQAMSAGDRAAAAEAFLVVAGAEEEASRPDRAAAWAEAAHALSRELRDQRPAALALRRWGRALRARGDLAGALPRYLEALEISSALDDPRAAAEAAVGAGNVLEDRGLWSEAEVRYRQALELLDLAGLGPVPERWHALVNLHIALRSSGRVDESLPFLEQAAAVAGEGGDPNAAVFLENARGQLAMARGRYEAAEAHFRAALSSAAGAVARVVVGVNLAEALMARERLTDAAQAARQAELDALSAGAIPRLPEVYRILGRIAAASGHGDAFVLFERALELVREHRLPPVEEARTLQAYAEAESRIGDAEAAGSLMERATALYEELGIGHARHPWSEVHAAASAESLDDNLKSDGDRHD